MPAFLRVLTARVRALFRLDAVADEIRDELQFHLEMRTEEFERNGEPRPAAERHARERVGNIALHRDHGYDIRGGGIMETILQDVRYTFRLWRRQPSFAAVAILTLAMGIGLSTALFSVIDAARLHPLPYPHPEQLVSLDVQMPSSQPGQYGTYSPSLLDVRRWRSDSQSISAIGAIREGGTARLVDSGAGPERIIVGELGEGSLNAFGVTPILGRDIMIDDVQIGAPAVVLLGHRYWSSHFGGRSDAIGQIIRIVGEPPATIIGVLPSGFYPTRAMWKVPAISSNLGPGSRGMGNSVYARMRPGVTIAAAQRELTELAQRIAVEHSESTNVRVTVSSLMTETTSGFASTIQILSAAVGFVLLIACVNVAGLLLARGAARGPELSIRTSIGAGRSRLIRQLLTESLVLGAAGGLFGILLASMSLDALVSLIPLRLPSTSTASLSGTVLTFALALAFATSLIFGVMPALTLSRISTVVRVGRQHGSALPLRRGQFIIGIEVALAILLLAAAGLMVRSFARTLAVDVGFDPRSVLTMEVTPSEQTPEVMSSYYPALVEKLRAIPGVAAVSAIDSLPMGGSMSMTSAQAEGGARLMTILRQPLPGYFEALGQRVTQGRIPAAAELASLGPVAILNEEAAKALFPSGTPVGQSIKMYSTGSHLIVAVVANVRQSGPLSKPRPETLTFATSAITRPMTVVIRLAPSAHVPTEQLRQAALSVGPPVLLERVRSGTDWIDDSVVTPWHRTLLFGLLGGLALLLTLVGIFGTTAYAVAQRTREIGVRMAFGALPWQVVAHIVSGAAWPTAIGVVVGLGGASVATSVIAKFLFQTTPTDPLTFALTAGGLTLFSLLAAWLPARRAARVDPVTSLRSD